MSKFKGTQGNWKSCTQWDNEFIEIGTEEYQGVAFVNKAYLNQFEANAKLIVCAPEMLNQLENIVKEYDLEIVTGINIRKIRELIKSATT